MTAAGPQNELEALLAESVEACRQREASAYDAAVEGADRRVAVLFGAGGLGRVVARMLRDEGVEVVAFADNATRLWGEAVDGIPVFSPEDAAARFGSIAVFIVTIWSAFAPGTMPERIRQLRELGSRHVVPFQYFLWRRPDALPYFNVDLPSRVLQEKEAVWRCAKLWEDERSLREYVAQVKVRIGADFSSIAAPERENEYFPPDLVSFGPSETYIDAGAFDGDSLAAFIAAVKGEFRLAVAYEPDPANYRSLCARLAGPLAPYRARIAARQQALSDRPGTVAFLSEQGMSSRFGPGEASVEAVALDSILDEGIEPTYMKFDVEGFEPQAIAGAMRSIQSLGPKLAICVYHKQEHLWTLPLAVHDYNRDYAFHLRPYGFIWDEVCYAIPRRGPHAVH